MKLFIAVFCFMSIASTSYASEFIHNIYVDTSSLTLIGVKWTNGNAIERLKRNCEEIYGGQIVDDSIQIAVGPWTRLPDVVYGKCKVLNKD